MMTTRLWLFVAAAALLAVCLAGCEAASAAAPAASTEEASAALQKEIAQMKQTFESQKKSLQETIDRLENKIKGLNDENTNIKAKFDSLSSKVENTAAQVKTKFDSLSSKVEDTASKLKERATSTSSDASSASSSAVSKMQQEIEEMRRKLTNFFAQQEKAGTFKERVVRLFSTIKELIIEFAQWSYTVLSNLCEKIGAFYKKSIKPSLGKFGDSLDRVFSDELCAKLDQYRLTAQAQLVKAFDKTEETLESSLKFLGPNADIAAQGLTWLLFGLPALAVLLVTLRIAGALLCCCRSRSKPRTTRRKKNQ